MEFLKDIKINKYLNTYKLLRHKLFNSKMVNKTNNKNSSLGTAIFIISLALKLIFYYLNILPLIASIGLTWLCK